jgi:hypothetical protein
VFWASVRSSIGDSVLDSVRDGVRDSIWDSIGDSVRDSIWDSIGDSVRDSIGNGGLREELNECYSWGQHDAHWIGFYDFFRNECGLIEQTEKLKPLTILSQETCWHLFYEGFAILSEKPTEIHFNKKGKLHSESGPAIKWADGYELYRLNGVDVSKDIALMKPEQVTIKLVRANDNDISVRREIINKVSFDEWIKRGYVSADGLLQKFVSKKTLGEVEVFEVEGGNYVVKRGDTFAHGHTMDGAIKDLRYKIGNRDTSEFKSWKLDDEKTLDDLIPAYRVITGACEIGVKDFVASNKLPEKMKVKTAIRLTKGHYGHEQFEGFFK